MSSRNGDGDHQVEDVDDNTLRVLLSTDNHLGFCERDPVRGLDSFAAFEEVLYLAKKKKCDMVLLAGDLFHFNKPSRRTLHKTMEIIRRYCMGADPVKIQIVSDQAKNFRSVHGAVNYEDEFYSVDLPIFSIHGNHDDPTRDGGTEMLAALDLLSVSNFVNYFGRQDEVDKVEVSPVLIQKGTTRVALYGMGSMRDERLNRMWQAKKVRFLRPESSTEENDESWFNIFALHQNRDLGRGSKNCVHESMIPEWMDLVVWGHEHECMIIPTESVVGTFRITQPGSSVATSLTSGESIMKQVGVLDIRGNQFRISPIPLTQVRAFITKDVSLVEHSRRLDPEDPKVDAKITAVLEEELRLLIHDAREKSREVLDAAKEGGNTAGDDGSQTRYKLEKRDQILARIRVDHSGFTSLNNQRFGARFVGEVANPTDILLFQRNSNKNGVTKRNAKSSGAVQPIPPAELLQTSVEDLVRENLDIAEQRLELLNEQQLSLALESFVDKSQATAISETATGNLEKQQRKLVKRGRADDDDKEKLSSAHGVREELERTSQQANISQAEKRQRREASAINDRSMVDDEDEEASPSNDDVDDELETSTTRRAGIVNQKQRKTPSSTQRASTTSKSGTIHLDDDSMDEIEEKVEKRKPTSSRSVAKSRRSSSSSKSYDIRNFARPINSQSQQSQRTSSKQRRGPSAIEVQEPKTSRGAGGRPRRTTKVIQYAVDDGSDEIEGDDREVSEQEDDDQDLLDDEIEDDEESSLPRSRFTSRRAPTKRGATTSTTTTQAGRKRTRASQKDRHGGRNFGQSYDLDDDWGVESTETQNV